MQRLATDASTASTPGSQAETTCPVCGAPVEGIEATRPGEHRFVGCDHYASARFLRRRSGTSAAGHSGVRIGP